MEQKVIVRWRQVSIIHCMWKHFQSELTFFFFFFFAVSHLQREDGRCQAAYFLVEEKEKEKEEINYFNALFKRVDWFSNLTSFLLNFPLNVPPIYQFSISFWDISERSFSASSKSSFWKKCTVSIHPCTHCRISLRNQLGSIQFTFFYVWVQFLTFWWHINLRGLFVVEQ